ncbi:hypothetical protein [Actinacidiphila oryziradicis]|uniref:Uncharacterized protein n=1 Tax=Actinacidiphila oryziradicis TaxID=2571141 RepID=A0A4U0RGA5_9ACTN|nr:hypothetical protein [Actinacidiphila oryziradicis]TJZ93690.1 hypothetical protein FCI23_54145 [Actinacidiphila oryziradicis]
MSIPPDSADTPDFSGPAIPPMPDAPPLVPSPKKRPGRSVLVGVTAVMLLAAGIGLGMSMNQQPASNDGSTATAASASDTPVAQASTESPADRCSRVVMDALQQTADALNAGQSGLKLTPLLFQYGTNSDIYRIAVMAQSQMISASIENGDPNGQVLKLRPYVDAQCAQSATPAAVAPPTANGTAPTADPISTDDFPFVEGPTVTETIKLGASDWARYPSQSACEAAAVQPSALRKAADEQDESFAGEQKGKDAAEVTVLAYARKYVQELQAQGYPQPENAVASHWSNLCYTLANSDPGQ